MYSGDLVAYADRIDIQMLGFVAVQVRNAEQLLRIPVEH